MPDNQALIQQIQKTSGSLTLSDRVRALKRRGEDNILLLDCSGSMFEEVNRGESKIDVMWSIVQRLRGQGIDFKVCEFNSDARWSDGIVQPRPEGSTALDLGLAFVASSRPRAITVITDGYPDDPKAALAVASELHSHGTVINCLYVGPASDFNARDFCKQLADASGGGYEFNDLKSEALQLQAGESARLMLTEGQSSATHKPVIEL